MPWGVKKVPARALALKGKITIHWNCCLIGRIDQQNGSDRRSEILV
jgi:hypothetical protein